jgi:hypothetical protein
MSKNVFRSVCMGFSWIVYAAGGERFAAIRIWSGKGPDQRSSFGG